MNENWLANSCEVSLSLTSFNELFHHGILIAEATFLSDFSGCGAGWWRGLHVILCPAICNQNACGNFILLSFQCTRLSKSKLKCILFGKCYQVKMAPNFLIFLASISYADFCSSVYRNHWFHIWDQMAFVILSFEKKTYFYLAFPTP